MKFLFANYASAELALAIDSTQTLLTLVGGTGARFPSPTAGQGFPVVVENVEGEWEVCVCTSRAGDQLTVVRGAENSVAKAFNAGSRVELRLTVAVMEAMMQSAHAQLTGNLNAAGNSIQNAIVESSSFIGGTLVGSALRAADNNPANQLVIPNGGAAPTVGGNTLWHSGNHGAGSGLDADRLHNLLPSHFLNRANHTGTQPASSITGLGPSATVDATNASNITSGTLATARLAGGVLRHQTEGSAVVRIVTTPPVDTDGANGDIWLVVAP